MTSTRTPEAPRGIQVIQTLWDLFQATGRWPSVAELARRLDKLYDIALEDALKSVPSDLLSGLDPRSPVPDSATVRLTLAGVAAVEGSGEERDCFTTAVRLAAELNREWIPPRETPDAEPVLTALDFTERAQLPAAGRDALVARVGALLLIENWGWSTGGVDPTTGGWRFSISRHVRRFRGVATFADYWSRAHPPVETRPDEPGTHMTPAHPGHDGTETGTDMASQGRIDSAPGRDVFLVHGRDRATRDAVIELLRAFDLRVLNWREAASHAGGGTPYTGDIVRAGMEMATAVVVLLTPDDVGYVRAIFRNVRDGSDELRPTGQARLNVVFEAGMAMALDRERVVLVEVGATRTLSDTAGVNVIRLRNDVESRKDLAARLRAAGLAADTDGEGWRTVGDFDRAPLRDADIALPDVPQDPLAAEAGTVDAERAVLDYLHVQFSTPGVSRVDTPFEIPGLDWPQIAIALRDLHDSTPRYVEGVMAAQADYPIVITSLTERGRREVRRA